MSALDLAALRKQFPALEREERGRPVVYFDGPAGSQVPQSVIDAVAGALRSHNANTHGRFAPSREIDAVLGQARAATADLLGARDPSCVAFGANMTSLTLALGRSLSRGWKPGDEVIVTRADHDANVWPWVLAARDAGATVHYAAMRSPQCTLDLDDLRAKLSPRTRLVAIAAASNAVGTLHPVAQIAELAHAVGAEVFVDAVHYAPHGLIDVEAWGCDYLACSAYKFFGPHVGILWGRRERLAELPAYQVRPASDGLPERWSTGTGNHEGIAGTLAAIEYLASLGRGATRRAQLIDAFEAIRGHELTLAQRLLGGLSALPAVRVWGPPLPERAPTFGITHARRTPAELSQHLADRGIYTWDGHFYAIELIRALGLEESGGVLRVGLLHYNTAAEVDRLVEELARLE